MFHFFEGWKVTLIRTCVGGRRVALLRHHAALFQSCGGPISPETGLNHNRAPPPPPVFLEESAALVLFVYSNDVGVK